MAMTDRDDLLVQDFFKQAARQQFEDNGFTERVMQRLPRTDSYKVHRLTQLWTVFCVAVGIALFFAFDGWEVLKASMLTLFSTSVTAVEVFFTTAPTTEVHLNPWMILLVVGFVLVYLPYQTARKLSATL